MSYYSAVGVSGATIAARKTSLPPKEGYVIKKTADGTEYYVRGTPDVTATREKTETIQQQTAETAAKSSHTKTIILAGIVVTVLSGGAWWFMKRRKGGK